MESNTATIIEAPVLKIKMSKGVATEYGISVRTLNRWFRKAGLEIPSGLINPFHLRIIYNTYGRPKSHKTA